MHPKPHPNSNLFTGPPPPQPPITPAHAIITYDDLVTPESARIRASAAPLSPTPSPSPSPSAFRQHRHHNHERNPFDLCSSTRDAAINGVPGPGPGSGPGPGPVSVPARFQDAFVPATAPPAVAAVALARGKDKGGGGGRAIPRPASCLCPANDDDGGAMLSSPLPGLLHPLRPPRPPPPSPPPPPPPQLRTKIAPAGPDSTRDGARDSAPGSVQDRVPGKLLQRRAKNVKAQDTGKPGKPGKWVRVTQWLVVWRQCSASSTIPFPASSSVSSSAEREPGSATWEEEGFLVEMVGEKAWLKMVRGYERRS